MTATVNKLSAGSGYEYLTRSICCDDATSRDGLGLASYYSERGDVPGHWLGSGLDGVAGINVGDGVTPDQMKSLFGAGMHPLAIERNREFDARPLGESPTRKERVEATYLGAPFRVYDDTPSAYAVEVARRFRAYNRDHGAGRDEAIPAAVRAEIRSAVAAEFFVESYGREPDGPRELSAAVAKWSRPSRTTVGGFDVTFSPVKSVSTLWALADPGLAAKIELAHQAAIRDALGWLEQHALFTREGTDGVRQVNTRGLVAAAFVHRDSRAGDPDLHTHVVVANKVQTLAGKWLSVDGRPLYKAEVSISETYNTALEKHLVQMLGVRFIERADTDPRKRPIREIEGVDPGLNQQFSKRRSSIKARTAALTIAFQRDHGRPPTPVEAIDVAQQATLETRQAKHEPRTLAEQRATWRAEAVEVLGSENAITRMVHTALAPAITNATAAAVADEQWLATTAKAISATMASKRATWQYWHVYAEAQRRVRGRDVTPTEVAAVVDQLTNRVLTEHAVCLPRPADPVREPDGLRRKDGASVYTVAGSTLFTTQPTLAAEHRLVEAAGRRDGYAIDAQIVGVALLECTANGARLNPGQATLVHEMATSGARVQLAIAPAGSGKTTAMRALATAWMHGGGTVVGLAPSAVAASELGTQISIGSAKNTDTLAKLVHAISTGHLPMWAQQIGPKTLLIIDEAGMADTLSLDAVVGFALQRGASVRLIGDDQQLAAIGAGGVLRDIRATHGALQLSELMRFRNPAEGAASLALREGRPAALGFYLDHQRVHIGDEATLVDDIFQAWRTDTAAGLESLMLAPTRDLVAQLNQRARADRLNTNPDSASGAVLALADGNQASVGDVIITRVNNRSLRISASDWVKNGDRWEILAVTDTGIQVRGRHHHRKVFLPHDYVATSVDLGYACTVHTAQGVTADTTHGLISGEECRQQVYTLATRGRQANHLYVTVASDGDPHNLIHADLINPQTATEILEAVLARDGSATSATTLQRQASDPVQRLGDAAARYRDALSFACEELLGTEQIDQIEAFAEHLAPGVSTAGAWPALRAHLLLIATNTGDVTAPLAAAVAEGELDTARDPAGVLDWRLDPTGGRSTQPGPLPWLPAIPGLLAADDAWGPYLAKRAALVSDLADQVRIQAQQQKLNPGWVTPGVALDPELVAEVEVWRAAHAVPADDLRPTGPSAQQHAAARWQRRLNHRVSGPNTPAIAEWGSLLDNLHPRLGNDSFTPALAQRLAAMSRAGLDTRGLLDSASRQGHLPDDHPAAALWWRLNATINPAVAARIDQHDTLTVSSWEPQLEDLLGPTEAHQLRESSWWPALLAVVDHGLQRGWRLPDLLALDRLDDDEANARVDLCQALVWRASIAVADIPDPDVEIRDFDQPPEDMYEGWTPPESWHQQTTEHQEDAAVEPHPVSPTSAVGDALDPIERGLLVRAISRDLRVISPEQLATESDLRRAYLHAAAWDTCPIPRARMVEINTLAQHFFAAGFAESWARPYLSERFGFDLTGHEHFQPGYAPAGWTALLTRLRTLGVSEEELLITGVAARTRDGRLIDKFRDRVTFPITNQQGEVLGFVGRRAPGLRDSDRNAGPKYLNTADTPLFHKGGQLFGLHPTLLEQGALPVVVEGPMDAIAVTLATAGTHVGLAPLGTALTEDQAIGLARIYQEYGRDPIVATDADAAGQAAAQRDFWLLAGMGLQPLIAALPAGADPSSVLTHQGAAALAGALHRARPLAKDLLDRRLAQPASPDLRRDLLRILATASPQTWDEELPRIAATLDLTIAEAERDLLLKVKAWDLDPRRAADRVLHQPAGTSAGIVSTASQRQWLEVAASTDPRIATDPDRTELARLLGHLHGLGYDVPALLEHATRHAPLGEDSARELIDRITSRVSDSTIEGTHEQSESPRRERTSSCEPLPAAPPEEMITPPR